MPNWSANKMTVTFANKEAALKCLAAVELNETNTTPDDDMFSIMAYFRAYPAKLGYDRQIMCDYYGCKWFENDLSVQSSGLDFEFTFDTPWSPPQELADYMWANKDELGIETMDLFAIEQGCDFMYCWSTDETVSLQEFVEGNTDFDNEYFNAMLEFENGEMDKLSEEALLRAYPDFQEDCPFSYLDEKRYEAAKVFFGFHWDNHFGG